LIWSFSSLCWLHSEILNDEVWCCPRVLVCCNSLKSCVGFVVEKLALWQAFHWVLWFSHVSVWPVRHAHFLLDVFAECEKWQHHCVLSVHPPPYHPALMEWLGCYKTEFCEMWCLSLKKKIWWDNSSFIKIGQE
jgi:hypothetical protein